MLQRISLLSLLLCISSAPVFAGVCDYRPSQLLGSGGAASTAAVAGGSAAAGLGAKAAGVYTLVHATSGLTMIGGTWAGASAAGTAGIVAGTGGLIGSTVAVITAPVTIIAGTIAAAGVGAFEGACFFQDIRIADYQEVDAIVKDIAVTAPAEFYSYIPDETGGENAAIRVRDAEADTVRYDFYRVEDLYIVNGVLMHRDWGVNTTIGLVAQIQKDE